MVKLPFVVPWSDTDFDVANGDLSSLEIRDSGQPGGFHYFYDTTGRRLIKDFILHDGPQVALMCQVTLVRKGDKYSPRITLWKKDKTSTVEKAVATATLADVPATREIKALVSADDGHDNFWKLMSYIESLAEVDVPREHFRMVDSGVGDLLEQLATEDRDGLLAAVKTALGGLLTDADIVRLSDRKAKVDYFHRLLHEDGFFAAELTRTSKKPEALWQEFFEQNTWILASG